MLAHAHSTSEIDKARFRDCRTLNRGLSMNCCSDCTASSYRVLGSRGTENPCTLKKLFKLLDRLVKLNEDNTIKRDVLDAAREMLLYGLKRTVTKRAT